MVTQLLSKYLVFYLLISLENCDLRKKEVKMNYSVFLNNNEAEKIHQAALKVLSRTGVKVEHKGAEQIFLEAGAEKNSKERILIPPELVEDVLENVKREVQLFDREGNKSLLLKNGENYFGTGSDALHNIDIEDWTMRKTRLEDIGRNIKIADALDFDFVMSMGLPQEVPKNKLYSSIFTEMVRNTTKPMVITSTTIADVEQTHKIATMIAGGEEEFRDKPFILAYMEPISPLQMDKSGTERLLYCVEKGIPVLYAAGNNSGSGAPVSPEGGVIQGTAESLSGLVLAYLKDKDVKFVYGANTSSMDMKKMIVCYGAPEWAKTVTMYAEMGKYYDLPNWGTAGCSDTYRLDPQAAWEAQESIHMAVMSCSTMNHDVGFLGHGELYDPRMLVLTDEMIKRSKHLFRAPDLSEEEIEKVIQVIDDVSLGRDIYPSHPYTFENFRKYLWIPPAYVFRGSSGDINEKGFRGMAELLKDEVNKILSTHEVKKLPEEINEGISDYLSTL